MNPLAIAVVLTCLATLVQAQETPGLYAVVGVAADDTLNIRSGAGAGFDVIGTIAPDATGIEVTALNDDRTWGRINAEEQTGWVSMTYLAAQTGETLDGLPVPLSCYGTEPFWDLSIAADASADFRFFGETQATFPTLVPARSANLLGRWGGIADAGNARAAIVVASETCSDGMSDRLYGLRIDLILETPQDSAVYSGCCTLATD